MDPKSQCAVCGAEANQKCAGCHSVVYCNREHQKAAWKKHKLLCKPFTICNDSPILGRYLMATRPIRAGEVILKEPPLIWGPAQLTAPVCLSCGRILNPDDNSKPCDRCGWPLCDSEKCQNDLDAHKPECDYTIARGNKISISNFIFPHPNYQCLTVLRMLYQKDNDKKLWDKLMKLESHCEERKGTEKYESDKISVANFIRKFYKLEEKFSEEEIMKVCGILQVNGHEIPLTEPPYVAIYEQTSMYEHNCRPNCCKSFTSEGEVLIHAAVDIEAGDHLSICYTDPLWGTINRRHYLFETKFFQCGCDRCTDPTEFATYFSGLRCYNKECKGYILPETFLTDLSKDFDQKWKCFTCNREVSSITVQNTLDRIGHDLNAMQKGDPKSCQLFLDYYGKLLHPNHYYMTDVRIALAQLIGQTESGLNATSDEDIQRKLELCSQVVQLIEKLDPAELRVRGVILFELHAALAENARRRSADGQTDPQELRAMMLRSKDILTEAIRLMQHEPDDLPEGKIVAQAKINLMEMENLLRTIPVGMGDLM